MNTIIPVLGGLGLLLYGMTIMGDALQKAVGNKMRNIIGVLTKNKFIGALVGFLVTVLVGSSSATTIMTIGFVNAGIMSLDQVVGIIMGSNLGTTVTAQLIAFNLDEIAPLIVGISVFIIFIGKEKKKLKSIGEIGLGFGMLFMGMTFMKDGLAPLQYMPWFSGLLVKLNNPIIGVLVGLGLTTLVQSSAASIGLLQALSSQGLLTINQAFPILFGDNIGTTTTGLISSIGTNRNGKRTAMLHFLFNVIGTLIFMIALRIPIQYIVEKWTPMNVSRQIANAHTLFNLINIVIQLPFSKFLVKAACFVVHEGKAEDEKKSLYLDSRILRTPSIAVDAVRKEIQRMSDYALDNINHAYLGILNRSEEEVERVEKQELIINSLETEIVEYLVLLSNENISQEQYDAVHVMMSMTNDLERVGDHAKNISELATYLMAEGLNFTEDAMQDFTNIVDKAKFAFTKAMESFKTGSYDSAFEASNAEEEVDKMERKYRLEHISRLSAGNCIPATGVIFLDALSNVERISDHADNIANYIIEVHEKDKN